MILTRPYRNNPGIVSKALPAALGLVLFLEVCSSRSVCSAAAKAPAAVPAESVSGMAAAVRTAGPAELPETLRKEVSAAAVTAAAASLCSGTYKNGAASQEHQLFMDYGWHVTPYLYRDGRTVIHFDVAVGNKPVAGVLPTILAVRGSQSRSDWALNLKTKPVPFAEADSRKNPAKDENVPAVHQGFDQYARALLATPVDIDGDGVPDPLPAYLKAHPERRLLFTGHSLGGAAATLAAARLAVQGVPREQIPVITFGAPAVGNRAFGETWGSRIDLLRVVTSLDPVPGSLQTFIGGGYAQFGKVQKFSLSRKYASFQHPISFYYDLAVKHFYDSWDKAIAAGALAAPPQEYRTEGKPLVALAVYSRNKGFDDRFSPDLGRFVLDEYRALLPSYTVVGKGSLPGDDFAEPQFIGERARKAGASWLIVATVDQKRIGQTRQWYLTVTQHIRPLQGRNLPADTMGSASVSFDRGVVQTVLALLEEQKQQLKGVLPFVEEQRALWIGEEGDTNEDH